MGPGLEKDKTTPKGGSKCSTLSIFFLSLNIFCLIVPVRGFALRYCRISDNTAICINNKLRQVPLDIPSTVNIFDLSVNKIVKIQASDFKNLTVLKQLDLNRNNISQIDTGAFSTLISLKKLNLNNNKLRRLGENVFDGLSRLVELRLKRNGIEEVAATSFKSMTSLTFLDISNNKLHSITKVHLILQHLPHLRELYIYDTNLPTFQSWQLTNSSLALRYLDVSLNPLKLFQITADVFPNLTWFNIGGSRGKQNMIWDVRNKTFLSRLSSLDISGLRMTPGDMKTLLETVNSSLTSLKMYAMKYKIHTLIKISCTIPTMSTLKLQSNGLKSIPSDMFASCVNVTKLDLAGNKLVNIDENAFTFMRSLRILNLNRNKLTSVPAAIQNRPTLDELDLSKNNISELRRHDFANQTLLRKLSLYNNIIPVLPQDVFRDLNRLQTLKLQTSQITKLNGAFKKYLPNLKRLHLNGNKLSGIKPGEFKGLRSLENLSLHDNEIKTLVKESFTGLTNLTEILLQSNLLTKEELKTGAFNALINLRRLDLSSNHIIYKDNSLLPHPPFSKLSHLEELNVPSQRRRARARLPQNFLEGLGNLLLFRIRTSQLVELHTGMFKHTPRLQTLDVSSNDLRYLDSKLFAPLQNLSALYMSRASLQSLDFLIDAKLTKLEFLQVRKNQYSVVRHEVIKALPALLYLDLQGNAFTCDCSNIWFIPWLKNDTQTQVYDAYNFLCNYPPVMRGKKLLDFDFNSFCTVDVDFICFVTTTCTILCSMVATFTYHFMRWQLVYAYYLFLAWLYDTKNKNMQAENQYDAFISYNVHDEPWVIGDLLPKLENEQGWKLCLHHRDFEPGKPIIDNITDAIYGSRKTICVISRRYLESEWCSREIQAASFRLFDEQKDVLILVFLEEIPGYLMSPYYRMRKLLKRQSYLSWPRAGEHSELFWEKLRQALKTGQDLDEDRFHLSMLERP
ncbi:toll-like receptor 13 [Brachyistius frenatus]|uniref:toll-like receptor 13 n=1 Tax=Brachyistius frenatus TaxID=100188 RepID=UPI0037E78F73